jgi:hypothetical protein
VKPERRKEILSAGLKTATEQMNNHPARTDYPHSFSRLYDWLEDKVFDLYEAIQLKNYKKVWKMSGEIIITASEIAEYSEIQDKWQRRAKQLSGFKEV